MNSPPSHFLDKPTLFSLILIFSAWFLWEKHIQNKYRSQKPAPVQSTRFGEEPSELTETMKAPAEKKKSLKSPAGQKPAGFSFEDDKWRVEISSQGLGVQNAQLKQFFDRQSRPVNFQPALDHLLFEIRNNNKPVLFNMKKTEPHLWAGSANIEGKKITAQMRFSDYFIHYKIFVQKGKLPSFQIHTIKTPKEGGASGFIQGLLFGEEPPLSFFAQSLKEEKRILYMPDASEELALQQTQIIGFGGRYFGSAFLNFSDVLPDLKFQGASKFWAAKLSFNFSDLRSLSEVQYKLFFGPKSTDILKTAGEELVSWVDFGFLSFLAQIILAFLKLGYSFTGNWGLSIILLTLLVRLLLLPLNLSAYQSMKVMKKIQPEMQALREKYKKDPKRMNQEVLELMKKNKAQPLGGCLPMLLQFPVFFALYRVLAESFELYQAPFAGWILDLSSKDPFYILPLLMGASMYIQQKITPTNMDPAQQKILKLLPFIFTLFMINLPSGLTLYIFISTVFGLVQQYYFLRFDDNAGAVKVKKKQ